MLAKVDLSLDRIAAENLLCAHQVVLLTEQPTLVRLAAATEGARLHVVVLKKRLGGDVERKRLVPSDLSGIPLENST